MDGETVASYIGLSSEQAAQKFKEVGPNAIAETKTNPLKRFILRFWGPIPWMLEVSAVLELVVGKYVEAIVIIALLLFNNIMGFLHEGKAEQALELLKQKLTVKARVLRDNKWTLVDASFLVPEDIIHLRMGDFVPADIKLIDGHVQLDQSALTGESLPIEADPGATAYSGSIVKRGEATGVVVATGKNSYFGKTAELVRIAKTKSNLSALIFKIVKYIMYGDIGLALIFVVYAIVTHMSIISAVVFILIILIAAVPIALPATYTLSTALGAVELSKEGVLTTKLSAIEESSSMTLLCSDKTGTLTENKLILEEIVPINGYSKEQFLEYAMMASDESSQDPLDDAIFKIANSMNIKVKGKRVSFTPFDPAIKRTEAVYEINGKKVKVYKGQTKTILSLSKEGINKLEYEKIETELALKGERVLSVAADVDDGVEFIGLLGFLDPEREDSKLLISELKNLGVRVVMLTGDTPTTAKTIAKRLGIGERVSSREEMLDIVKSGNKNVCANADAFAGIYPEDKYDIAKSLQDCGFVVGMTGDGVNDSPALKQAEVGIAVSNATDVAKAAASIVLTQPGLINIVSAIKTSREIFQRMLTWILNKIAKTIEISIFTVLSVMITHSFVVSPLFVILLLFTNDFLTMSISTDHVTYSPKPNNWKVKNMIMGSAPMGIFELVFSFGALAYLELMHFPFPQIQTLVFMVMVLTGQAVLYLVRTGGHFYKSMPSKYMIIATIGDIVLLSIMASFGVLIPKVPFGDIVILIIITIIFMFVVDLAKIKIFKTYDVRS
jgi:H+-transporting ATPase